MNIVRCISIVFIISLSACNGGEENRTALKTDTVASMKLMTDTNAIATAIDSTQHAQNSLDWSGSYKGTLPCADCKGVETEIVLYNDQTYTVTRKYLGKRGAAVKDSRAPFTWVSGSMIRLDGVIGGPSMYMVGENMITQLDMNGKMIKGSSKEKYILKKQQTTQQ